MNNLAWIIQEIINETHKEPACPVNVNKPILLQIKNYCIKHFSPKNYYKNW